MVGRIPQCCGDNRVSKDVKGGAVRHAVDGKVRLATKADGVVGEAAA